MIEAVIDRIEEPPGREIYTEITEHDLPADPELRKRALLPFARLIVASYRNPAISVADLEELSEAKAQKAIDGVMEAQHLLVARKEGEIVGLLAYSVATPESHPNLFASIHQERMVRRGEYLGVQRTLEEIDAIFITNEMAVEKKYRGNGVSHELRERAFESVRGKHVAAVGEILSRSSVEQRLKLPGPTVWADEVLNPETIPLSLSDTEVKIIARVLGRAYLSEFHPESLAGFDRNSIFPSALFEKQAKPATEPVRAEIRTALAKILERQQREQKKGSSDIVASVAVTLLQP